MELRSRTARRLCVWCNKTGGRVAGALLAGALLAATVAGAQDPAHGSRWESVLQEFERSDRAAPPPGGSILFLGSSSIRLWDLARYFPGVEATNRGFGGSQISDSLAAFERLVMPHRPRHLVFYAGDNDIAAGESVDQVFGDLERFVATVADRIPGATVYFVAIKPSLARWSLVEPMREVNRRVARLAQQRDDLVFVDIDAPMLGSDGKPRGALFVEDGLHLSHEGYLLFSEVLKRHLPTRADRHVFPLDTPWAQQHNHGSSVVEHPDGSLLVSWFHGSGERRSDDVAILGSRFPAPGRGTGAWSEPFVLADTPGFPDTNCTLLVDNEKRLWLFWPTILDNRWEGALLKYRMAEDWAGVGAPEWRRSEVLHMKPGDSFPEVVSAKLDAYFESLGLASDALPEDALRWREHVLEQASDKLTRRLGWFTRSHPVMIDGRMLVGLYSDGFSFSSATWSDDGGANWTMSEPIVGGGAVQPSFARRTDGTLVAFMRDNGPAPKKVLVAESGDRGETWSVARDHPDLVDSGAGVEALVLASGRWLVVHNDVVDGRHRLAVSISDDEGRTFPQRAWLESEAKGSGRFHYPSAYQAADGTIHLTYSYHLESGKTIHHAAVSEGWLLEEASR